MRSARRVSKKLRGLKLDAADLVPLHIVFDRFCDDRYQELNAEVSRQRKEELSGQAYAEFTGHLKESRLDVVLINVKTRERVLVPPEAWVAAFFLERPLLNESRLGGCEGEFFRDYGGWLALVSQRQFEVLLKQSAARPRTPGPKPFDTDALACARQLWPDGKPERNRALNAHSLCAKMKSAGKVAPALSTAEKILRRLPDWGKSRTDSAHETSDKLEQVTICPIKGVLLRR